MKINFAHMAERGNTAKPSQIEDSSTARVAHSAMPKSIFVQNYDRFSSEAEHGYYYFSREDFAPTNPPVEYIRSDHYDALVEALTLALPYVESALEDQGYKRGVVDRMTKTIRAALAMVTK